MLLALVSWYFFPFKDTEKVKIESFHGFQEIQEIYSFQKYIGLQDKPKKLFLMSLQYNSNLN